MRHVIYGSLAHPRLLAAYLSCRSSLEAKLPMKCHGVLIWWLSLARPFSADIVQQDAVQHADLAEMVGRPA